MSGDRVNDPAIMNEDDFYEQIYGSSVSTLSVIYGSSVSTLSIIYGTSVSTVSVISYNKYIKKQN